MKEAQIEANILVFLLENGVKAWKNDIKGFFNEKKGFYQKNKSPFIRTGISDISFIHKGQFVCIEVKRPSEMSFFDRPIEELRSRFSQAQIRGVKDIKRYIHAVEQREFLDDVIEEGGIGFFASSVDEVREKLKNLNILY